MKQIEGQICLDDYVIRINQGIAWKDFNEHCIHRGWLKAATETESSTWMCGFANKQPAKCWDDWIVCKEENCPLNNL